MLPESLLLSSELGLSPVMQSNGELLAVDEAGWEVATVSVGPRSGCYLVSAPAVSVNQVHMLTIEKMVETVRAARDQVRRMRDETGGGHGG